RVPREISGMRLIGQIVACLSKFDLFSTDLFLFLQKIAFISFLFITFVRLLKNQIIFTNKQTK
ncbi:MAG: hypothetical protein KBT13_04475, partial [Bacteroidales bacterium]|nr:hypothetical protein [Candidatus Sodaliphilus limicaballi]